ncbi:MAG: type II toxin-antitoxin system PemK/MazF family toxin [Bacteroidales bacterium]
MAFRGSSNQRIGIEPFNCLTWHVFISGTSSGTLIIQTDLLNNISHPSTIICSIATRVRENADILRVHIRKGTAQLSRDCDIMIDQARAIDNRRLVRKVGTLPHKLSIKVKENLLIVLDLE